LFAAEPHIQIISVDADAHRSLGEKYSVQGFPTIKFIAPGVTEAVDYSGGRSVEAFVEFLNKQAGSDVTADGSVSSTGGLLPNVHDALSGFGSATKEKQEKMLNTVGAIVADLKDEKAAKYWTVYAKIGTKVIAQGVEFIGREKKRLMSILQAGASSVTPEQRKNFQRRVNVLTAFDEL
jgi:protein disulfide-isomerase A6